MQLVLDKCDATTGWTTSDVNKISLGTTDIKEFIANDNTAALMFHVKPNSTGAYVNKTITADLTNYTEVVLSIYSARNQYKGSEYSLKSDFLYKIDFLNGMDAVMLPVFASLTDITIDVSSLTNVTRIRITSLTDTEDYLVISQIVAVKDQLPVDIYRSLKTAIETERDLQLGDGIAVGTLSAATGDSSIYYSAHQPNFDKYAVVKIKDITHSEIHQLWENNERQYAMTSLYSGETILNNYTNANVYLQIPVEYGKQESEIILPGIVISGFNKEAIRRTSEIQLEKDTYTDSQAVLSRKEYVVFEYTITIDCEARQQEVMAIASQIVSNVIARRYLWINGRKYDIEFQSGSSFESPAQSYNSLPKITYNVKIEVKEDVWGKTSLPMTSLISQTETIVSQ